MKRIVCFIFLIPFLASSQIDKNYFEKLKNQKVISDPSVEWKNFGPGMSGYNEEFWCHPTDPNVMFMGPDMHVAYGTWDNGKSWQTIKDSDGMGDDLERVHDIAFSTKNPDFGLALERRGKLFETKDRGRTWKLIYTIPGATKSSYNAHTKLAIHPTDDNIWFNGYTWELSNNGFHKDASIRRIAIDPTNNETFYAAANDDNGGLYVSKNKGGNWERVVIPSEIKSVNNVFIDRNTNDILISTGRRTGIYEEGGVWRSKNNGKTWERIFKAPYVWQAETSPVNPKIIVISVPGQIVSMAHNFMNPGIYMSKDAGESWTKINKGLGNHDKIVDVKPDPYNENVLWCAAWGSG